MTQEGAKEHRKWHNTEKTIKYIAVGAAVLPVAIPGAIGVAIGGTALGIGAVGQAAASAAAGAAAANFTESTTQQAMTYGLIINKQQRWWGQEGYDYEVV